MIYEVLKFVLPIWFINIGLNLLHPLSQRFGFIKRNNNPIDGGRFLGKYRILGDSTTLLGLFVALVIGLFLEIFFPLTYGFISGLGAFIGHTLGSFIKRRLGFNGGKFVPILDHGDGVIFTGVILVIFYSLNPLICLIGVVLTYIVYPILCFIGYKLKLRKKPI